MTAMDWTEFGAAAAVALGHDIEYLLANPEEAAARSAQMIEEYLLDTLPGEDWHQQKAGIGEQYVREIAQEVGEEITGGELSRYTPREIDRMAEEQRQLREEQRRIRQEAEAAETTGAAAAFDLPGFMSGVTEVVSAAGRAVVDAGQQASSLYTDSVSAWNQTYADYQARKAMEPELPYATPEYAGAVESLADALEFFDGETVLNSLKTLAGLGENGIMPAGMADWIQTMLDNTPVMSDDDIASMGQMVFQEIERNGGLNYTTQKTYPAADYEQLKGLPGVIARAITSAMSDVRVYMDGTVVGNLVAPAVSRSIWVAMER